MMSQFYKILLLIVGLGITSLVTAHADPYQIIYFTTQPETANSRLSATRLGETDQVQVISDLESLETIDAIDALILDDTTIDSVDQTWLLERVFEDHMVIALINVSPEASADLLANPCLTNDTFNVNPNAYIIASQHRYGENPADVERAWIYQMIGCGAELEAPRAPRGHRMGFVTIGYGASYEDNGTLDDFLTQVIDAIDQAHKLQAAYQPAPE
ncbi:MAG: hypothetical protein MUF87_10290 [Anaerolineae bacterium]|jgi:hypothetical protein|nr:hypothetical protein [Anaerolineae bacterium]